MVISPPQNIPEESEIVSRLFKAGLERFHVRKENIDSEEMRVYLSSFPPVFLSRLVLHSHHHLIKEFKLGGVHWKECERKTAISPLVSFSNFTRSTSIHSLESLKMDFSKFDYVFFSPVFNSISKKGYRGIVPSKGSIRSKDTKVIALGGVEEFNLMRIRAMGFDGVAVLGAVWKDPQKAVENYEKLINTWRKNVLMS